MNNLSGKEYWEAAQLNAEKEVFFLIRYCSEVKSSSSALSTRRYCFVSSNVRTAIPAASLLMMPMMQTSSPSWSLPLRQGSACRPHAVTVLYAAAYLYEHREQADHGELVGTLRSLLFGIRKEVF